MATEVQASRNGFKHRHPSRGWRALVAASILVGGVIAGAEPAAAVKSLVLLRTIQTHPFVGTTTSIVDNEGLAYVPADDTLWIVDDSTGQAYAVNRQTGMLGQVIPRAAFRSAVRFAGSELAGPNRAVDLEAATYDPVTDRLYFFSGNCCTSSTLPTVFRLSRPTPTAPFAIDSWQPLLAPYNDLSGVGTRKGQIWVGYQKTVVRYDYVTNTTKTPHVVPGVLGILGIGFSETGSYMWITDKDDHVKKYRFSLNELVPGYDFALSAIGVRDARAVEVIGKELYISDGYDYYGATPDALGVRVYLIK